MDPPCYIDVGECQDKDDGAEDRSHDTLEPEHPGGSVDRRSLDGKGGVASGAVFGFGVGTRRWFGGVRYPGDSRTLHTCSMG